MSHPSQVKLAASASQPVVGTRGKVADAPPPDPSQSERDARHARRAAELKAEREMRSKLKKHDSGRWG